MSPIPLTLASRKVPRIPSFGASRQKRCAVATHRSFKSSPNSLHSQSAPSFKTPSKTKSTHFNTPLPGSPRPVISPDQQVTGNNSTRPLFICTDIPLAPHGQVSGLLPHAALEARLYGAVYATTLYHYGGNFQLGLMY